MEEYLVYGTYAAMAVGAGAIYCAMPNEGRPRRALALVLGALAIVGLILLLNRAAGEYSHRLSFGLLTILAVGGAVRVVTHRRPVYSALYFVLVVLSTAAMAVLAGAEFLAAALVIVYAGAILVTYVFVIMLAQQPGSTAAGAGFNYDLAAREPAAAVLAGFVLVATIAGVVISHDGDKVTSKTMHTAHVHSTYNVQTGLDVSPPGKSKDQSNEADQGNTLAIGRILMTRFAVSVELAGVLLMVAMVGAISLARKPLPHADGAMTMAPGEIGKRVKPF